jgi:hypothetical protein
LKQDQGETHAYDHALLENGQESGYEAGQHKDRQTKQRRYGNLTEYISIDNPSTKHQA